MFYPDVFMCSNWAFYPLNWVLNKDGRPSWTKQLWEATGPAKPCDLNTSPRRTGILCCVGNGMEYDMGMSENLVDPQNSMGFNTTVTCFNDLDDLGVPPWLGKHVPLQTPGSPTLKQHIKTIRYTYYRGWMKTLAIRSDFDFKFSGFSGFNLGFRVLGFRVLDGFRVCCSGKQTNWTIRRGLSMSKDMRDSPRANLGCKHVLWISSGIST